MKNWIERLSGVGGSGSQSVDVLEIKKGLRGFTLSKDSRLGELHLIFNHKFMIMWCMKYVWTSVSVNSSGLCMFLEFFQKPSGDLVDPLGDSCVWTQFSGFYDEPPGDCVLPVKQRELDYQFMVSYGCDDWEACIIVWIALWLNLWRGFNRGNSMNHCIIRGNVLWLRLGNHEFMW